MRLKNEFNTLYKEIEELAKREQHHFNDGTKFAALKTEILNYLSSIFGEESRHYGVVRLTKSPTTVYKVMSHIVTRTQANTNLAVNM